MRVRGTVGAMVVVAAILVQAGCDVGFGGRPTLTIRFDSVARGPLSVGLMYDDPSRCAVLSEDAFATLNGRELPLFRGERRVIPPHNDDGGVVCNPATIMADTIPADLTPPWTIEIHDASGVMSARLGPGAVNPFELDAPVYRLADPPHVDLTVPVRRPAGVQTPAFALATLTAPDGRTSTRGGGVYQAAIESTDVIPAGWPEGTTDVRIDVYYYPYDVLLGCENADCKLADPLGVSCDPGPPVVAGEKSCSALGTTTVSTQFHTELTCAAVGYCP